MGNALTTIDFHSSSLFAVERPDGVFGAVKPICDHLSLVWQRQRGLLRRAPTWSEGITVMVIPSSGGAQETTLLRLDIADGDAASPDQRELFSGEVTH